MDGFTLDVDSPFFRVQSKGLQRTLLTEPFRLVDIFVSSVVSGSGISLGVFVWTVQYRTLLGIDIAGLDRKRTLHDTAQGIENSLGGKVLRGDEVDKVFLAFFFLTSSVGSWPGWMLEGPPFAGYCRRRDLVPPRSQTVASQPVSKHSVSIAGGIDRAYLLLRLSGGISRLLDGA